MRHAKAKPGGKSAKSRNSPHSSGNEFNTDDEKFYQYANMPMQYTAVFHGCKKYNLRMKKCDYFLIFAKNIDCGH